MSGDDEKREDVLRSGKHYFDRAWNDPPEFKYDAQAKAAAATATRGTGGGQKLNKRVGYALETGSPSLQLPPPSSTHVTVKAGGDVPQLPNLQDAGARSLADMPPPPPPPPPLSASQTPRPRPLPASDDQVTPCTASDTVDVDVDICVANLERVANKDTNISDVKRKDIKKRIGMMATKWKSGSLDKNVEAGMGRVSQLLMAGDAAGASSQLQSIMVDFPHIVTWAVGIKHLVASAKPIGADEVPQKGIANPL